MIAAQSRRILARVWATSLLATLVMAVSLVAALQAISQSAPVSSPTIEIVEDDRGGFARLTEHIIEFQRRANAEIATRMNAIERGDDPGAFILALAIAFAYGVVHAFGPGHGKFVIVSYFLGREARVMRGVAMAVHIAIIHVIAAVVVVWLADHCPADRFRNWALRSSRCARRELPDHCRHRGVHAVPGGAGVLWQAVATEPTDTFTAIAHSHSTQPWPRPKPRTWSRSRTMVNGHGNGHGHGHGHGPTHVIGTVIWGQGGRGHPRTCRRHGSMSRSGADHVVPRWRTA